MWCDRRTASVRSTLPDFNPGFATHGIQEGAISAKVHNIVIPAGAIRSDRSPPFGTASARANPCGAVTIQFPIPFEWGIRDTL